MIKFLVDNPLLLLFVIAALSYPLGRIKIKGGSLGVAAVLFVSLAVGAISPELKLPEVVYQTGNDLPTSVTPPRSRSHSS